MELLLIWYDVNFKEDRPHYVRFKSFARCMYNQPKHKEKINCSWAVYNALVVKKYWKIIEIYT